MTLLFYPDAGDWVSRIRLGDGFSFSERAESGTFAMSQIVVEDPLADLTIVGHHAFRAIETDCSWQTLFRGYFADRNVSRAPERALLVGVQRQWDATVIDANATLQFEVIRGSDGRRPAETDTERLAWLLSQDDKGPISSDDTWVLGYDIDLDKADYRGQTMADVLADCATASGANYWAAWEESIDSYALHYYRPTRAFNSSTLSISNVLADIDGDTVYAPSESARLNLDPSRIFSGVYYEYGEKGSSVFEESASVLAAIGHRRETREENAAVRTAAKASIKADRYLDEADTDLMTINVTLHKVPTNRVNLIRAGQRIQCKFTHLPGFTSFTWLRIVGRTVAQDGDTQEFYRLDLELADPKQAGARNRHKPAPVDPDTEDGSSVAFSRKVFEAQEERDDCQGGLPDEYNFAAVPSGSTMVMSSTSHFTPGIFVGGGCNSPSVGYSGIITHESWLEITGTPSADAAGLKVSYVINPAVVDGVANGGRLVYGVATDAPTIRRGAFDALGYCSADSDDSFVVPANLVETGGYIVIAPGWQCSNGANACSDEVGDPLDTGFANSGRVELDSITIIEVTIDGSGDTLWRPLTGDIDGTNKTFTLQDWNERGVPRLRIGPVEYALGRDYTIDRDAGTATFRFAPWVGADLNGRWDT